MAADNSMEKLDPATLAIVSGRRGEPGSPLSEPVSFASAFRAGAGATYAREGNPTWAAFESAVAALEGGGECVAFSTGMAAATALSSTLSPGARVLAADTSHVEVRAMFKQMAERGMLRLDIADAADPAGFERATPGAQMVWIDSISNPGLDVARLDATIANAHDAGAKVVVDSTLATPILQRPLELGADAVLHSASKYLGGHSDLLLGVVTTRDERLADQLRNARLTMGSTPGTMEAWLALRGLRTLHLRVERGQASARVLADRLREHPGVSGVRYPGIGAMIAFEVAWAEQADAVCAAVEVIVNAGSLGGVESLIERHAHWHSEPGVPEGLLRLSVGCEDVEDLWADLKQALETSKPARPPRPERASAA